MNARQLKLFCDDILEQGRDKYDLMMAIVSRINNDQYHVFAVSSQTGVPIEGDIFDLKDTYCRDVVELKKTIAITEIDGVLGMRLHPLYPTIPCEVYISSPIMLNGKVWGTLNFTHLVTRATPFTTVDIQFNEAQAARIAAAIAETQF